VFAQTTHVVAAPHGFACVVIPATRLYISSFIEILSGVSEPRGVKIWPFPLLWLVAFTTACTTVQAVINPHSIQNTAAKKQLKNQQVPHWGLTYIYTCRPTSTRRAIFHKRRICSVTFTVDLHTLNFTSQWLADSSDFGLLGEQSSPKWEIPCPVRR